MSKICLQRVRIHSIFIACKSESEHVAVRGLLGVLVLGFHIVSVSVAHCCTSLSIWAELLGGLLSPPSTPPETKGDHRSPIPHLASMWVLRVQTQLLTLT